MFSKDTLVQNKLLEEEWQKKCAQMYGEDEFRAATSSGIPLKPVYTPADIGDMDYNATPLPGQYPYTRGLEPLGYRAEPWAMFTGFGYGSGSDTHDRWEYLRNLGAYGRVGQDIGEATSFRLLIDLPTQRGYDPDEPEARGRVGGCGVSLSTLKDIEMLFSGVSLEDICVQFIAFDSSLTALAMYVVHAERRGIPQEKLFLRANNILYRQWHFDTISFPPKYATRLMVEQINHCVKHMPRVQHTSLDGYQIGEAGATPVQEVALTLATAIAVTEECIKAGLHPDDVVPGYYHHEWFGMDFFENIAKIRAKRRLWAKIFKERFGCRNPESLLCRILPQTGGTQSIAQEPLNNIIRATLMTLGCVLAGVDGIFTTSYDEPLCIPTEEAVRIAIRTQQIIYHESNVSYVTDPLGGSYYVEWLTNRIEEEVVRYLHKMDDLGGYLKCWESGWIRKELEKSANECQQKIDSGDTVIVGQNKYRLPDEEQPSVPLFPLHDAQAEEEAIQKMRKFRGERDSNRAKDSLDRLQQAAIAIAEAWPDSCGILMPAILEAVRADATLGEIQKVLQEVFGYVYT